MDIEAVKQALSAARVDTPPVVEDKVVVEDEKDTRSDQIDLHDDGTKDVVVEEEDEKVGQVDLESELGVINYFREQLGFEGEAEGTGLDALVHIAKTRLEEANKVVENPLVQQFLAHVEKGGDIQTFEEAQPTNVYGAVQLDESDTKTTEAVVREALIVLRNYDDEEEIADFINDLKDDDKLFAFAEKHLPKLQKFEKDENDKRVKEVNARVEARRNEAVKYYKEVGSAFDKGLVPGVIVDKALIPTVKQLSMPDKQNQLGIDQILADMPTEHVATMNMVAYCLKNNKPFRYEPKVAEAAKTSKPIHVILGKGKPGTTAKPQTLGQALTGKLKS